MRSYIRRSAPPCLADYLDGDEGRLSATEGLLDWARQEGIEALWAMQAELAVAATAPSVLDEAFSVFANPQARSTMAMLLLCRGVSYEDLSQAIQERFDIALGPDALQLYRSVFWDTSFMTQETWPRFIRSLPLAEERSNLAQALSGVNLQDVRYSQGLRADVDAETAVRAVLAHAHAQFQAGMNSANPDARDAVKWADLTLKAANALGLKKMVEAGPAQSPVVQLFSVVPEKNRITSIAELQGEIAKSESIKIDES